MKKGFTVVRRNKRRTPKIPKTPKTYSSPSATQPQIILTEHHFEEALSPSKSLWLRIWEWLHRVVIFNEIAHIVGTLLSLALATVGFLEEPNDSWRIILTLVYWIIKVQISG